MLLDQLGLSWTDIEKKRALPFVPFREIIEHGSEARLVYRRHEFIEINLSQSLGPKGIEELYSCGLEIRDVPRHHCQTVAMSGGGELAIERGNGDAFFIPFRHQLSPDVGSAGIVAKYVPFHALAETGEPGLQSRLPLSIREDLYPTAEFTDSD